MNSQSSFVRLAAVGEGDPVHSQVYILLSAQSSSITVSAPASWLSRVPYFATRLKEPWISSSQQPIVLECTAGSTPESYLQCLRLLSSPRSWALLFKSVAEVLQILPAADHLLFQECWDVCMGFLAASPWSLYEEDDIRVTISKLNMEPSPDVKERLDKSHDEAFLQTVILDMVSTPSQYASASFETWCRKWLNHSSASFADPLHSILLKLMKTVSKKAGRNLPPAWFPLAKCVLLYSDAQQFTVQLVNSDVLLPALVGCAEKHKMDANAIFKDVLEKVATRVVLLSNKQRERLLGWSKYVVLSNPEEVSHFNKMRQMLADTVPMNNADQLAAMKSSCFDAVLERIERVTRRVSGMGEADLEMVGENI